LCVGEIFKVSPELKDTSQQALKLAVYFKMQTINILLVNSKIFKKKFTENIFNQQFLEIQDGTVILIVVKA
jgi:hypothetical protein